MIFAALLIQGVQPGPFLITEKPEIFWGVVASMYIGNVMLLILNLPMVGLWVQLLRVPYSILAPIVVVFCCVGVYSIRNTVFDIYVMGIFGVIGYILRKVNLEPGPMILAFVLGPILERAIRQALLISAGSPLIFFTRPISASWRVYVILSDAECNEGSTWEAIQVASNFHLSNLVVLLDRNRTSASGPMANRNDIEPLAEKWRAFNWAVKEVKGHDFQSINEGLQWSETITDRPAVIICHTEKGRGMSVVNRTPRTQFYV